MDSQHETTERCGQEAMRYGQTAPKGSTEPPSTVRVNLLVCGGLSRGNGVVAQHEGRGRISEQKKKWWRCDRQGKEFQRKMLKLLSLCFYQHSTGGCDITDHLPDGGDISELPLHLNGQAREERMTGLKDGSRHSGKARN